MNSAAGRVIIPFLPEETVNSLLSRIAAFNCGQSLRQECRHLLNSSHPSLAGLPNNVEKFCQSFNFAYGDVQQVITDHTLYHFYACGVHQDRKQSFEERLSGNCKGPIRPSLLPLYFTPSELESLSCPTCDSESLDVVGFTFDQRTLAVPFIQLCPIHGVPLITRMARPCSFRTRVCMFGKPPDTAALEFAHRAYSMVRTPPHLSNYERKRIWTDLKAAGWVNPTGRISINAFLAAFKIRFGTAFNDARLGQLCSKDTYIYGAIRNLTRSDRNLHPIWCLLFSWFASDCCVSSSPALVMPSIKPKRLVNATEIGRMLRGAVTVTQAAAAFKTDPSALRAFLSYLGFEHTRRTKTVDEKCANAVRSALAIGRSPSEVAREHRVSISTVYRLDFGINAISASRRLETKLRITTDRKSWIRIIDEDPTAGLTKLKLENYKIWAFLYRNDRAWLTQNSAKRTPARKVFPRKREKTLLKAAASATRAAIAINDSGAQAVHLSRYRIAALTGLSEYALADVLSSTVRSPPNLDSRELFIGQRIKGVLEKLDGDINEYHPWLLAKFARLREETVLNSTGYQYEVAAALRKRCNDY